jgi:coniferyl-aldehyde dehydrogenase
MHNPEVTLERQRAAFFAEGPVSLETRMDRLDRCLEVLVDHQQELIDAVNSDFGNRSRHVTLMTDLYSSVCGINFVKKHLRQWMKPEKRRPNFPLGLFGAQAYIQYQPKGVIGLMAPWNVPISMVFNPLADALGAGNRCMIKPSEFTPASSELMANLIKHYFDETELTVVTGGPEIGAAFSTLAFDHIIFTGATGIGRHVMRAAAANLTPVTLELGGKSPVIIGQDVDMRDCAYKLIAGKCMNAGQLCISPDYCFVPEAQLETLLASAGKVFDRLYPTVMDNPDYVSMISARHHQRVMSYIDEAAQRGVTVINLNTAEEIFRDHPSRKIPLHLIVNPGDEMLTMQHEIFGPILNVKTYRDLNDVIAFINQQPRALALYYFGRDPAEADKVLDLTISGGVTVNDIGMHVGCEDLPFGGVGPSGMGSYHGIDGFRTFSHAKSVFIQGRVNLARLAGTLPPYGKGVDKLMARQIKK